MKLKEIEQMLLDYISLNTNYNHRENALKEFDKVREKFKLDDLVHIGYIINDYPKEDHFLIKLSDKHYFFKVGLNRSYLESLSKKDIHKIAKTLYDLFGKNKWLKENNE